MQLHCSHTPVRRKPQPDDPLDRLMVDPALNSTSRLVALTLVRHYAWSKDHCWPSSATLARRVGKSVGHVQRCLAQLERAGWIRRERTPDVPNGRRIWLLWRCAGAQPDHSLARSAPVAPARSKRVVIVNEPREPQRESPRTDDHDKPLETLQTAPVAKAVEPPATPRPAPRRPSFSLAELAKVADDPIIARELAKLTAPAPPPEPDPRALPTVDLLARLPGRFDLVMVAARRLCVETRDEKPATLRTAEGMARAVASRTVPAEVLAGCYRQAMGPLARERGKVLVTAWKRDSAGVGMG
jgi:hypothetical protein